MPSGWKLTPVIVMMIKLVLLYAVGGRSYSVHRISREDGNSLVNHLMEDFESEDKEF